MKKVNLKWHSENSLNAVYPTVRFNFSWVKKDKFGQLTEITARNTCRESFILYLKTLFNFGKPGVKLTFKHMYVCVFKRFPISSDDVVFEHNIKKEIAIIEQSCRLLNIFERYLGWKLTRVYRVKDDKFTKTNKIVAFILSSSVKWMRAPQLISLYALLVRLATLDEADQIRNLKDFETWIEKYEFVYGIGVKDRPTSGGAPIDFVRISKIYPHLFEILDNVDDIFFGRSMEEIFRNQTHRHGISYLVDGVADAYIVDKLQKLTSIKCKK